MTMEQARIQARLMNLGVHIHTATELVAITESPTGLAVQLSSIYIATRTELACASLLLVTMRDPCDDLYQHLLLRQSKWDAAGIKAVRCIGDAYAPGTVAAAVYAGHKAARELDAAPLALDSVPFARELVALQPVAATRED